MRNDCDPTKPKNQSKCLEFMKTNLKVNVKYTKQFFLFEKLRLTSKYSEPEDKMQILIITLIFNFTEFVFIFN